MQFLEDNQISCWLQERNFQASQNVWNDRLPDLANRYRASYAHGQKSGIEAVTAARITVAAKEWTGALLIVRRWGIWPSGEDWPKYYRARDVYGERRSLETAPGHLFFPDESASLAIFLTLVMENAWDADLVFTDVKQTIPMLVKVSHDEWVEVQSVVALEHDPFAA